MKGATRDCERMTDRPRDCDPPRDCDLLPAICDFDLTSDRDPLSRDGDLPRECEGLKEVCCFVFDAMTGLGASS